MDASKKRIINAWAMYDWANSVYSLVITSSIFPIYFNSVTANAFGGEYVNFFGFRIINTVLYGYSISFSFLLIACLSPILSGIADYSGNKKSFMRFFAFLGSVSCAGLFFFTGKNIEFGILCSVLASVGFAGSIVFYNAFLPEITTPDQYDRVSAKGFSLGYIGSVILMIANLITIMRPEWVFFPVAEKASLIQSQDATLTAAQALDLARQSFSGITSRLSFLTVGLWWFGFSQYTFYYLKENKEKKGLQKGFLKKGYQELRKVWNQLLQYPSLKRFLIAFFFYNLGVQTIMYMAATFGDHELKLSSGFLIAAILLIQLVAIVGSYLFAFISKKQGNIFSLSIMLVIWIGVCIGALFVNGPNSFLGLASVVGMVMGGIQSLSRSTYSKLLPPSEDHASYFSFYDICDKMGVVLGTALFALMNEITGNMRSSIYPLMFAFIIGLTILQFSKNAKLKTA